MKIDELDGETLEQVRRICQELFHQNHINEYVFAPNDAQKRASESYSFVMAHYSAIEELLDRCGWRLCHDPSIGVLYLDSVYAEAKMPLSQTASCFLLAMRLIFEERKMQASATGEVFVTAREIVERLTTLNAVKTISKQDREKAFRVLAGKNLVARMNGSWGDMDVRLALLPAIGCTVSQDKIKAYRNMLNASAPGSEKENDHDLAAKDAPD